MLTTIIYFLAAFWRGRLHGGAVYSRPLVYTVIYYIEYINLNNIYCTKRIQYIWLILPIVSFGVKK
jgi:hypothetical protein